MQETEDKELRKKKVVGILHLKVPRKIQDREAANLDVGGEAGETNGAR